MGAKAGREAMVKAVNEGLANADWQDFLVNEWARGCKNLSVIVIHTQKNCVAICIVRRSARRGQEQCDALLNNRGRAD